MVKIQKNNHLSIINNHLAFGHSTTVERSLQIRLFMQNKPNFRKSQVNVNKLLTKDYEKKTLGEHGKNKPNSNPIQSQNKPKRTQIQNGQNERK
jgi:hypothetical protein